MSEPFSPSCPAAHYTVAAHLARGSIAAHEQCRRDDTDNAVGGGKPAIDVGLARVGFSLVVRTCGCQLAEQ